MNDIKHTKGPWKHTKTHVGHDGVYYKNFSTDFKRGVGEEFIFCAIGSNREFFSEANAALIAAAPELLAALVSLANEAERRGAVPKRFIAEAWSAINKATG